MTLPIVHHPAFRARLPEGHRFPMSKFERLAEILVEDGLADWDSFRQPEPVDTSTVALAHDESYVLDVFEQSVPDRVQREIGFPVTPSITLRSRAAVAGTLLAARIALQEGLACNTAGGSHHARRSHGAGFCVFNDVAIAIRALQQAGEIERALVIDCDVHQGDGTAEIFTGDESVFTVSVHSQNNYPVRKVPSDIDIDLPDDTGDEAYLNALKSSLPAILDRTDADVVFYNAGVDPHGEDRLGRLGLTDQGLANRDAFIIDRIRSRDLPVACVIGGGYSNDIDALAQRHSILHRTASRFV